MRVLCEQTYSIHSIKAAYSPRTRTAVNMWAASTSRRPAPPLVGPPFSTCPPSFLSVNPAIQRAPQTNGNKKCPPDGRQMGRMPQGPPFGLGFFYLPSSARCPCLVIHDRTWYLRIAATAAPRTWNGRPPFQPGRGRQLGQSTGQPAAQEGLAWGPGHRPTLHQQEGI